jgi:uncharacterized protein YraI
MLGTQTQYPNQYPTEARPVKGRSWRKPVIALVLLALVGIGGWWIYQNSTAGPAQSAAGQLSGSGTTVTEGAVAQITSASTAANTASISAGQPAVQAAAATDQAVEQGLKLASLAGVAEVAGTPVWNDDGTLLTTLDSGALLSIKARTSDGTWLGVTTDTGSGWAQTSTVIAYGLQNLATAALPEAVASANTQPELAAAETTATGAAVTAPGATDVGISLADLIETSASSGAGSQPARSTGSAPTAKVATTGSRLNVRSGPGTDYSVVAKAGDGAEYQVVGRSAAGDWLLLQLSSDTSDVGWVSAGYVELSGDIQTLPVENA